MKRVVVLLSIVLTAKIVLAEEPVYFADANLKEAVESKLGISDPTPTGMLGLTYLNAGNRGIVDLTGLEYATNLTSLDLYINDINDISPLSGLTNLTNLRLDGNRISDISPLSALTNLTSLTLYANYRIKDISALSGLINLTHLSLMFNKITDISPLSGLTNLTSLGLGCNPIRDVNALSGLTNLTALYVYSNEIADISPLSGLTNLTFLNLSDNQISNISALAELVNLTGLYLDDNQINDISSLSELIYLKTLVLSENQITEITVLPKLSNLTTLKLASNNIVNCSILGALSNLEWLDLQENQIEDISGLSNMANLTKLYLQGNPLNTDAYCAYLPLIEENNPGVELKYDANPNPFEGCTPVTIFVDTAAEGTNDGSSWPDAYTSLQDALAVASRGEVILVAEGTYKPAPPFGDREATFQLIGGVGIYGGFPSGGAAWEDRDPNLYETILSGDLNGDDAEELDPCNLLAEPTRAENSYHVVTGDASNAMAILDGFTISAGNANTSYAHDRGGGIYNYWGGRTMVFNCTLTRNAAARHGGGVYNYYRPNDFIFANSTFSENAVTGEYVRGGAMAAAGATVTNCTFSENFATGLYPGGGAIDTGSSTHLTNCTFIGNVATGEYAHGGGIFNHSSSAVLVDCNFTENVASGPYATGGAIHNEYGSTPSLTNCTFVRNSATSRGGAMSNGVKENNPLITGCIFVQNSADWGGAIHNDYNCKPVLTSCVFIGNTSEYHGGGMCNDSGAPTLTDCTFIANTAGGGGAMENDRSRPVLVNCTFSGNSAFYGGGVYNVFRAQPDFINCIISGNSADRGGGIYNSWEVELSLTNCTFAGNLALDGTSLACDSYQQSSPSVLEVTNCILWDGDDGIFNGDNSEITITYSDVQGGWTSEGNIEDNPLFVEPGYWADVNDPNIIVEPNDPNAIWIDGDYHLLPDSPCINAGDPNYIPEPNETDLDGNPRIIGGRIDIGAYEYQNTPPVAVAGPNQIAYAWIDKFADVNLDGSGSYDDDNDVLDYYWSWTIDGNDYEANGVSPTIELPVGEHTIELIVNDGTEDSEPDQVTITVIEPMESRLWIFPRIIRRYSWYRRPSKMMAWVRLPEGVTRDQIDDNVPLMLYPGGIAAMRQHIMGGRGPRHRNVRILAFFDRDKFTNAVPEDGKIEVYVIGRLKSGQYFYGSDTVWIKSWRWRRWWPWHR